MIRGKMGYVLIVEREREREREALTCAWERSLRDSSVQREAIEARPLVSSNRPLRVDIKTGVRY